MDGIASDRTWPAKAIGVLLGLVGLVLTGGGAWLVWLGGSTYYLIAGAGCVASAWCYLTMRDRPGFILYILVFIGTCIWSFAEVGTDFWQHVPRLFGPALIAAITTIHWLSAQTRKPTLAWAATIASVCAIAGFFFGITRMPEVSGGSLSEPVQAASVEDWTAFGRTQLGARFAPASQITPDNVGSLEVAWSIRTGDLPANYPDSYAVHLLEATPLKVADLVYICTGRNIVIAADADTGEEKWRFDPKVDTTGVALLACRGVSYAETGKETGSCSGRIIMGTIDARLIALDAKTGKPCPDFGIDGEVQLKDGLGVVPDGYYSVTSPPAIANGVAAIGGWIFDGKKTHEPSGVIRGYDIETGELRWSWDSGAKDENRIPGPGEEYTRGSPNSWGVLSADPDMGMFFVPMGNATPDYVGMHRTAEQDRYSSSVVALDSRTGERRWHFQTVYHDLWDYDIGAQPVAFEMPMPDGDPVPALALPTKQGDIYILDRRTGAPLTEVEERPVPRGDLPGERYSPTQPFSVGFPSPVDRPVLEEKDMWGTSTFDQLWCRIKFRSSNYMGRYTPNSIERPTLQYPSNYGAVDWGSVAIGDNGKTMLVNSAHIAMTLELISNEGMGLDGGAEHSGFSPQLGTPYAANPVPLLSPLGIPCTAPPWGKLTAIDLASREIKWQRPFGTSKDMAPFGIAVPGAPNIGGSVTTGGGLVFVAATLDNYLRAFDMATGKELWRARLPAGGQAAPISYVSERTGRQYVVVAAGGHQMLGTTLGDYMIAYALPTSEP